ncbi:MAG: DUF692 family protein [Anaerolineae bacterium]|nr:DUF692 family protein [Anaerolineae bacterium]
MDFAINFSHIAARLFDEGRIQVDRFKCPAWPEIINEVRSRYTFYVHCPLRVGMGTGDAKDTETGRPADWNKYTRFLEESAAPWVSLHMGPGPRDFPDVPTGSLAREHVTRVRDALLRDVAAVVKRFGPERVVVENLFGWNGHNLHACLLPDVIQTIIRETGCGFLLDLSHARMAARDLGMDEATYIGELPFDRIREMHITGLQCFGEPWLSRARQAGLSEEKIREFAGEGVIDHLPMTADDWPVYTWAMDRIHAGDWTTPDIVAFEYGGVGGVFQVVTDETVLLEQAPRLYREIKR